MVCCCVPYCKSDQSKTKGVSFHEIPSVAALRDKWLRNIRRKDWTPSDRSVVCSIHFEATDFMTSTKYKRLLPGTVPTVFPDYPGYLQRAAEKKPLRKAPVRRSALLIKKKKRSTVSCKSAIHEGSQIDKTLEHDDCKDNSENVPTVEQTPPKCMTRLTDVSLLPTLHQLQFPRIVKKSKNNCKDNSENRLTLEQTSSKSITQPTGDSLLPTLQEQPFAICDPTRSPPTMPSSCGRPKRSPEAAKLIKSLQTRVCRQKILIKQLKEKKSRTKNSINSLKMKIKSYNLDHIEADAKKENFKAIFLLDQMSQYSKSKPRFSEPTLNHCLIWRMKSPESYEHCKKKIVTLPSRATLQRCLASSCFQVGITSLIHEELDMEAKSLPEEPHHIGSIVVDEISIKPVSNIIDEVEMSSVIMEAVHCIRE